MGLGYERAALKLTVGTKVGRPASGDTAGLVSHRVSEWSGMLSD